MHFFVSLAIPADFVVAGFSVFSQVGKAMPIQSAASASSPAAAAQAGPRRPGLIPPAQSGASLAEVNSGGQRRVAPGKMDETLSAEK